MTDTWAVILLLIGPTIGGLLGVLLGFRIARSRSAVERRREYWGDMRGTTAPLPGESFDEWARRNDV